jgi:hypothetical protein
MAEEKEKPPETPPLALPLRVDFEASQVMGGGIVLDKTGRVVAECPDLDVAVALVAKVNDESQGDVWRHMKMLMAYRENLRRGRKPQR